MEVQYLVPTGGQGDTQVSFLHIIEPHRQACGTACYVHTGDNLSKEHSPTAKAVALCVEVDTHGLTPVALRF